MALDFFLIFDDRKIIYHIDDKLHASIFNSNTGWQKTKLLKNASDYYSDSFFYSNDALIFINELYSVCSENKINICESLKGIENLLNNKELREVRLLAD